VGTRGTHNFIQVERVKRFGLNLSPSDSLMKLVNAEVLGSHSVVKDATIRLNGWTGNVDFLAVNLDDFEVILGDEFIKKGKVVVMPHLGGILIGDEDSPYFVKAAPTNKKETGPFLSTMQVKKGFQKGIPIFVTVLVEIKPGQTVDIPREVVSALEEFQDIMPPELPKQLAPQRAMDHAIELEAGSRLLA